MIRIEHIIDHSILPDIIRPSGAVVLDCGGNRGDFAKWATDRFGATVYSFEADPHLAAQFPKRHGIHSFNLAISGSDGRMTLRRAHDRCTSGVFNTHAAQDDCFEVPCRSLESVCTEQHIAHVDLLKLDIEGAELDVLERASPEFLALVDQITCEFHDFLDPTHIPRIKAVLSRMKRLGFTVIRMSYWTFGDVIMINRKTVSLGPTASKSACTNTRPASLACCDVVGHGHGYIRDRARA